MTKTKSPLRKLDPQQDMFVCDFVDAVPKSDMGSMEHPVFSLSTKPDMRPREYVNGDTFIKVSPSPKGLATVHDKDVLIYCISQLMAAVNEGRPITRKITVNAYELLTATNRQTSGRGYELLKDTLRRLQGTQIETNIKQGGTEKFSVFGLIDRADIIRETRDGRMQEINITLSDWVYDAIENNNVLTMSRQYFQLRKPIERRIYELARKHCGKQAKWEITLEKLRLKTGSTSTEKEFKRLIQNVLQDASIHDHMPEYTFTLEDGTMVVRPKSPILNAERLPSLDPDTYEVARRHAAGWDIRVLESEWRLWVAQRKLKVRNPDANFIKFCKTRGAYEDTFI